jgi:hypothetical protein
MCIDINTLFTSEVSKSDDQSILAAIVRPLLEVNTLAKFVRLCFNVLCFILALFSLQWFILLNRTRSLLFFTFEMEGLVMGNYLFVKMNSIKISEQHCEQIFNNQNN